MMLLRSLVPITTVAVLTLVAIMPWGLPAEDRFVLPLFPVVAIYYWTLDRESWLPEWAVFLAGLLLDVLTQGPLGYWALIYLVAYVVAVLASGARVETTTARLALFAGAVIAVAAFAWLAASAYFLDLLDLGPYVRGAVVAVLAACVISLMASAFRTTGKPARPGRLTRGQ